MLPSETATARVEPGWLNKIGVGELGSGSTSIAATPIAQKETNTNAVKIRNSDSDFMLSIRLPPVKASKLN